MAPRRRVSSKSASRGNGGRVLSNDALGVAIAKKQYTDTKVRIDKILKSKPHLAVKVRHLLESDILADAPSTDHVPKSTNKYRLLSYDHLKSIAEAMLHDKPASLREHLLQ